MRYTALLLIVLAGCASAGRHAQRPAANRLPSTRPAEMGSTAPDRAARIRQAIDRGVAFLVNSQNPDGSWGTGTQTRGFEILSMVPGSHDAYRVGTTALCVMALREAGEKTAHAKGLEYLIAHGEARRDSGTLLYNIWAHIYAIQALAGEYKQHPDPRVKAAVAWQIDRLGRYETYVGGWNYYDFDAHTQRPSLEPTSFGTSAGLVALWEARQAGLDVPQPMVARALKRLREMRQPNGAYLYGGDYVYRPLLPANRMRGSIGRNQGCNYALWLWQYGGIGLAESKEGFDTFAKEHIYIEMGRKRQFPHESWYQTAPYYYYFDHYYAARLMERFEAADRRRAADTLADFIVPIQEPDGSWWDYAMWDYHKPYGTAFAVMTLLRCQ